MSGQRREAWAPQQNINPSTSPPKANTSQQSISETVTNFLSKSGRPIFYAVRVLSPMSREFKKDESAETYAARVQAAMDAERK